MGPSGALGTLVLTQTCEVGAEAKEAEAEVKPTVRASRQNWAVWPRSHVLKHALLLLVELFFFYFEK